MSGNEIIIEKADNINVLRFNRPLLHNALNTAMLRQLEKALDQVERDQEARVLIFTGSGNKSFISGSDVKELRGRNQLAAEETSIERQAILNRIENFHLPSIAAINGYALGFGCELAIACTLRIASENASLGQIEINLGIIPGAGATQRLPRLIGKSKAFELILMGKIISSEEALRIGLVNKVVPHESLMEASQQWAVNLAEKSPVAIKNALLAINQGMNTDLATGLKIESRCVGACFASSDSQEGFQAFMEKRKPRFGGK